GSGEGSVPRHGHGVDGGAQGRDGGPRRLVALCERLAAEEVVLAGWGPAAGIDPLQGRDEPGQVRSRLGGIGNRRLSGGLAFEPAIDRPLEGIPLEGLSRRERNGDSERQLRRQLRQPAGFLHQGDGGPLSARTCCWSSCIRAAGTSPSSIPQESRINGVSCTAFSRASAGRTAASVSAGNLRWNRWIGSHTTVPAFCSALIRTSGVSLRKSS